MVVNLQWRDAMAIRGIGGTFTPAQKKLGWPETLDPSQLAAMQRPWDSGDPKGRRACWSLRDTIVVACDAGEIRHDVTVVRVEVASERDFEPISLTQSWPEQYTRDGVPYAYTRPAQYRDEKRRHVDAGAFAAWLAAQNLEPSPHVLAWFSVRGIAMPLAGAAVAPASDSPFPLENFAALLAYRRANTKGDRGPSWALGNQIDVGKAELARRIGAGATESDALNAMGRDLGYNGNEPRKPLKKALFGERMRTTPPTKTAAPMPSVVKVRDGKKVA